MAKKNLTPQEVTDGIDSLEERLDSTQRELSFNNKILKWVQSFMVAIVIVCFITFVNLIIDSNRFKGQNIREYQHTIERLEIENSELKIYQIVNSKIDDLQKSEELDVDLVKQIVISAIDSINNSKPPKLQGKDKQ